MPLRRPAIEARSASTKWSKAYSALRRLSLRKWTTRSRLTLRLSGRGGGSGGAGRPSCELRLCVSRSMLQCESGHCSIAGTAMCLQSGVPLLNTYARSEAA